MDVNALMNFKDSNGTNNVVYPITKKSNVISLEQDLTNMSSAINSASIALEGKVDKVEGKGLSTEDYTTGVGSLVGIIGDGDAVGSLKAANLNVTLSQGFKYGTSGETYGLTLDVNGVPNLGGVAGCYKGGTVTISTFGVQPG